ncbi:uncharacterized protein LOC131632718 [Vicia villosa]|uniref:uncharacterized protein LOC131632718 n=1 Tax=Vicia villosa TaxID=3911 RepID=UPI00273AD80C|nr:uncharacterized protein LOC131632718 [Vicia villosa]
MKAPSTASWISKGILKARQDVTEVQTRWDKSLIDNKFKVGDMYRGMMQQDPNVDWHILLEGNIARPRALFCLWLECHQRLATKMHLKKFGVDIDIKCCFCQEEETLDHLMFNCEPLKHIWKSVMQWIRVDRIPQQWQHEVVWITKYCKGKGKKCGIIKLAIAETVYYCWKYINDTCFGQIYDRNIVVNNIKETIIHRGWYIRKYREYIAQLLM